MKRVCIFIISIVLIISLIWWIGPTNIINSFKTANLKWLLLAFLIQFLVIGVKAIRWGFIINKPFEFKNNYIVKTIGLFAGNISPMRVAGEILNAIAGKNINKISLHEGLSAGLTERFFDYLIVAFLFITSFILVEKVRYLSIFGGFLSLTFISLVYFLNWRENTSIGIYKMFFIFFI